MAACAQGQRSPEPEGHDGTSTGTVRYGGRIGDFNPIHIRRGVREGGRAAGRILHGLYTMAQVARPRRRRGQARIVKRLVRAVRGRGSEQEITVTARARGGGGVAVIDEQAEQSEQAIIRQRHGEVAKLRRGRVPPAASHEDGSPD